MIKCSGTECRDTEHAPGTIREGFPLENTVSNFHCLAYASGVVWFVFTNIS